MAVRSTRLSCLLLALALPALLFQAPASVLANDVDGACTLSLPEGFRPAPVSALKQTRDRVAGWMRTLGLGGGATPVGRAWVDTNPDRPASRLLLLCYDIPLDLRADLDPVGIEDRARLFVHDQADLGLISVSAVRGGKTEQAIQIRLVRTLDRTTTEPIRILLVRTPGRQAVLALEGGSTEDALWNQVRAGVRVHSRADELPTWIFVTAGIALLLGLVLLVAVIRRARARPRRRNSGSMSLPSLVPGTGGVRALDGLPTFDAEEAGGGAPAQADAVPAEPATPPSRPPDAEPAFATSVDAVLRPEGAEAVEAPAESGLKITRNDQYSGS